MLAWSVSPLRASLMSPKNPRHLLTWSCLCVALMPRPVSGTCLNWGVYTPRTHVSIGVWCPAEGDVVKRRKTTAPSLELSDDPAQTSHFSDKHLGLRDKQPGQGHSGS